MSSARISGLAFSRSRGSTSSHFPFGIDSTTPVPKKRVERKIADRRRPGTRWIGAFTWVEVWKMVMILCVITPCLAWCVMRSSLISS